MTISHADAWSYLETQLFKPQMNTLNAQQQKQIRTGYNWVFISWYPSKTKLYQEVKYLKWVFLLSNFHTSFVFSTRLLFQYFLYITATIP